MKEPSKLSTDLFDLPIADIGELLRGQRYTALELVESAIASHDRNGERLGAYRAFDPDQARRQAESADAQFSSGTVLGALQGIPISVKDLYGVRGFDTFAGSPQRLPGEWEREGPLVAELQRQHSVIIGKTHTVEFAFGGLGTNSHWPVPRNPWDPSNHRVCGGSSAGAGVTLCEGSALGALGTDTAGSVRVPASFTGNVGLKTTAGRWSTAGIVPLSPTLDTAGLLTRTVADAIVAFGALDPAWGDPEAFESALEPLEPAELVLGVCDNMCWDDCSPGVAEGVRDAIDEIVGRGARIRRVDLPEVTPALEVFTRANPVARELQEFLSSKLPGWVETLDPDVAARVNKAANVDDAEHARRLRRLEELAVAAGDRLREVDAIVSPTVPITPPTLEQVSDAKEYVRNNLLSLRNTSVVNFLGLCAITIPVALDREGMPVGLQLIARAGHEEHLLAVARTVENVLGSGRERLGRPRGVLR